MIFRDDDLSYLTKLDDFKRVHSLFEKYNVMHTVAVIAKDLDKNPELVEYLKSNKLIDVQLHCWEHYDMSITDDVTLNTDIERAIGELFVLGFDVNTLYPPWNKSSAALEEVSSNLGLSVSNKKITLAAYIRCAGHVEEDVINFHYWADSECIFIEPALKIYTQKPMRCNI
mgnify:FL=1